MRSRELKSLQYQLEHLLNRVNRVSGDLQQSADELHQMGLTLRGLIDFTLPSQETTVQQSEKTS